MKRIGFAIGILLGSAAGLLLAPRRGRETRARVRETGREVADLALGPFRTLAEEAAARLQQQTPLQDLIGPCAPTL
ncbi:MAG: YtxH domain-containing protein [Armatimonadetes bacterium]|nr:YtxH domain-containing protein [Armatimonadota bacterium]